MCVGGPGKLVNAASVWTLRNVTRRPWVGQRGRGWPGNKTLWVVSACDEYNFDVGQVIPSVWAVSVMVGDGDMMTS